MARSSYFDFCWLTRYLAANGLNLDYQGFYSGKQLLNGGLGNGVCDGVLNVPAYQYDLGDCCKPLNGTRNSICNYADDCICHMFTDFHGRILNAKMSLSFFFLTTVFPRIVAAATILFWIWKSKGHST